MKKLFLLLFMGAVLSSMPLEVKAQCNAYEFTNLCIPQLPSEYNLLTSYKIDNFGGSKSSIEYSQVLSKGSEYMINICTGGSSTEGIKITLYDSKHQKLETDLFKDQQGPSISYPCKETGIYYISYNFETTSTLCGGSALGYKRRH